MSQPCYFVYISPHNDDTLIHPSTRARAQRVHFTLHSPSPHFLSRITPDFLSSSPDPSPPGPSWVWPSPLGVSLLQVSASSSPSLPPKVVWPANPWLIMFFGKCQHTVQDSAVSGRADGGGRDGGDQSSWCVLLKLRGRHTSVCCIHLP